MRPGARLLLPLLALPLSAAAGLDCAACHRDIAASFARTAHANASRPATADSILGSFAAGSNEMQTRATGVYFRMEHRGGRFYQTGVERGGRSRTEPFDLVIGSGRRGQSYLYWRDGLLFQLPVSYHAGTKRWINSPGYQDGEVHFGRGIPPQCLDCHAANFRLEKSAAGRLRYAPGHSLGIGCAQCHGEAARHEDLRRAAGIDTCARCHSGLDEERPAEPDVHGDQVGLLRASRCFQKSQSMTCVTCHNVHQIERDPAALSARCVSCHAAPRHRTAAAAASPLDGRCVECHMPVLPSKLIEVQSYRTHRIAIYRGK